MVWLESESSPESTY